MRPLQSRYALVAATLLSACHFSGSSNGEQRSETTTWRGALPADGWVRLRNSNGDITVTEATDDSVEVRMVYEHGVNAPAGSLKVLTISGALVACVLVGPDGRCSDTSYEIGPKNNNWTSDKSKRYSATMTVALPKGARLDAVTSNSDISITGARRDVIATTSNSDIQVSGGMGPLTLTTSNSDIDIALDSVRGAVSAQTSNSDITLAMPDGQSATLTASTSNGEVGLSLPGTIKSKSANALSAMLGAGTFPISLSTSNSSINIGPRQPRE
jgi:hypothetical protein